MSQTPRHGVRLHDERFEISFDGRTLSARRGDTLASALLANGIRLIGRSIKYRRGRGLLTAGPEDPNGLVTLGRAPYRTPNIPASQLALQPGMVVTSQNRWPSLRYDLASLLQLGSGFLGAGFYYKTFMWPSWRFYEPMIRRLAGFGPAPGGCALSPPAVRHIDCDVLVAGAGAAGLAAAVAAARAGAKVVLCERDSACGGELEFETALIEGLTAATWVSSMLQEIARRGGSVLTSTAILGDDHGRFVAILQQQGSSQPNTLYKIRARSFVAAMGSVERPISFVDNDRPGVMLLGAAERFIAGYGALPGRCALLFGNNDRLYAAARRLASRGMRICTIVDVRSPQDAIHSRDIRVELEHQGIDILMGHTVRRARGWLEVSGAEIIALDAPHRARTIACDTVLMSGGWSPALHADLTGGTVISFTPGSGVFTAGAQPARRALCGAAAGILELTQVLIHGHEAGLSAARTAEASEDTGAAPHGLGDPPPRVSAYWRSPASRADEKRQFVDFQNDVTVADLRQTLDEGLTDIEHVKRYTTLGVGTDQGRTSAVVGAAILAQLSERPIAEVGQFRLRPPYQPMTLKVLAGVRAGCSLRPERRTPLHDWHAQHGAALESMGLWMRPRYYASGGADAAQAGIVEASQVRAHGGIFDGSTLGKIEVSGAAAAQFLDRLYLTRASTIRVGRAKYMVNLREDGMVLDDGIVVRLSDSGFLLTVSTGHAEHMLSHSEFHRDTEYSDQDVAISDVTEAWAVIVCAGPASREALCDVLSTEWRTLVTNLSHMGFHQGTWRDSALRVLRASFSGELAYEVHCRPRVASILWQALADRGIHPYGIEALDILRVEKGYLTGAELTGQTSPFDLGMDALVAQGNPCVGRDLLAVPALHEPERPRLVGLRALDGRAPFAAGAQLTTRYDLTRSRGHVTSSVFSPTLGEWIGLALVARSQAMDGTELLARDPLRCGDTAVRVTASVHVDRGGERMKA